MAVPQLRLPAQGQKGARTVPRLQTSEGLLRAEEGKLLIYFLICIKARRVSRRAFFRTEHLEVVKIIFNFRENFSSVCFPVRRDFAKSNLIKRTAMKKPLTLIFAGALASALCACNNPNESGNREQNPNEIRLVKVSDEISAFFDENAPVIAGAIFYEQNDFEKREFVDRCVMINSVEEFQQIDFRGETPPELPVIDFISHTLVIGQWISVNPRYYLASRTLVFKQDKATMKLIVGTKDGAFDASYIPMPEYFWGLYPKINAEIINMTVERDYNLNN
jgi:hypothetical protein